MRYFDSFKIFHGKNTIAEYGALTAANTVLLAVAGILANVLNSEFFRGFVTGLVPFVCGVAAMTVGFGLICGVSNGLIAANPGYRYFRSLSDSAGHYRRALLFANLLTIVPTVLYAAVGGVLFRHYIIVVMTDAAVLMMGFLNFTCHMKSPLIRIGGFCVIGFAYGFYGGISDKNEDGIAVLPTNVTVIVCAVTAVFYIASVIVAVMRAEELWSKES